MDDLIGGLLMLMVAAVVIGALIAVALGMVAVSAGVGSLIVGLRGTAEFLASLTRRVRSRGGAARQPLAPEPAYELYVLGQLRRDLRSAADDAWAAMQSTRALTAQFAASHDEGVTLPLGIGALVGGYVGTAVGVVIGALLTLPVLIVAGVIIAGSWLLIGVLRGAEALRHRIRRTSYECPVDHERFPLPVYVCPSCGAEHRQLVPGRWGVIKRECECGKVALPTMVLNGRQRVPQRCPSGHSMAGIIGYAELLRVALVAGPRAGKSTFLAGALHELDKLSQAGTLALAVVDDSRSDFDAALDNLENGRLPEKTRVGGNPALVAEVQGGGRSRVLSLYDVAGESYVGDNEIRDLRFLEVPSGLVMLIDPLALDRLAADREDEIAAAQDRLRPSPVHPIRVLERMLGALHEAGAKVDKLPLAVVVGKTDALGIGDEITALEQSVGERAVPTWLESQGGGNFVRAVESDFGTVGWFHASALGRVPDPADRTAFVPSGTADPVLWLLRRNGVVPAATKFSPSQAADRLSGAVAEDFPPISSRGWAWRAIPAGVVSLIVMAGLAVGVVAAVRAISTGGPSSAYANRSGDTSSSSADTSGSSGSGSGSGTSSKSYPLMDSSSSPVVRDAPSANGAVVGRVSSDVVIVCTTQGDSVSGNTLWDRIESPSGFISDSEVNTGSSGPVARQCSGAELGSTAGAGTTAGDRVVRVARQHLEALGSGRYDAAFALMSAAYRSANPNWPSERSNADPAVSVVSVGAPRVSGQRASVEADFFARDRNATPGSDTKCREFTGQMHFVRANGKWRYDPVSYHLSKTVVNKSQCSG
jgi:hypothetical protein